MTFGGRLNMKESGGGNKNNSKFISVTLKGWLPVRNGTRGGRDEVNFGYFQRAMCL